MTNNGRVIALGFFDGVHIGHKALLDKVNERAVQYNLIPSVINFDIHPDTLVFNSAVDLIYSSEKRMEILNKEFGINDIIMIRFDRTLMETRWDDFLEDLTRNNGIKRIVVGYDFRLGYKGLGTPAKIREFCIEHEIGFDLIPAIVNNGEIVSSSLIRNCIRDGQMEKADSLLGRPFSISGRIRHGRSIGSKIGFPTINLKMPDGITVPSFGVYATNTLINGYKLCSITNVGTRPTFNSESDISVETNIFNYSGDLYGDFCEVYFYKKIRDEKRFSSPELLSFQIAEDVKTVNELFSKK